MDKIKESPWVVTVPLILLAIPSALMGIPMIEPMLNGQYFGESIQILPQNDVMLSVYNNYFQGTLALVTSAFATLPVALALTGVFLAWLMYIKVPSLPGKLKKMCPRGYYVLDSAYGFDRLNEIVFVDGTRKLASFFTKSIDIKLIDTGMVTRTFMAGEGGLARVSWHIRMRQFARLCFMMTGLFLLLILTSQIAQAAGWETVAGILIWTAAWVVATTILVMVFAIVALPLLHIIGRYWSRATLWAIAIEEWRSKKHVR